MEDDGSDRLMIELTAEEAILVLAALRQFEPYWPGDMSDLSRAQLLADVRTAIEHVIAMLKAAAAG